MTKVIDSEIKFKSYKCIKYNVYIKMLDMSSNKNHVSISHTINYKKLIICTYIIVG